MNTGSLRRAQLLQPFFVQLAVGQLENSSQISKVRHDLARIMTVLRERDFGVQPLEALPEATAVAVQEPAAEEEAPKPKRGRKKKEEAE